MTTPQLNHPAAQQTPQPFPAEVANFALNEAANNKSPKAPHYFGFFKLDGMWYSVSTWIRNSPNGKQFLSNSVRPCTQAEADKQEAFEANRPASNYTPQVAQPATQEVAANTPNPAAQPVHTGDVNNPYDEPVVDKDDDIPF